MGKEVLPIQPFQLFCPNINGMQIFMIHTCPFYSLSYFNNKQCILTMRQNNPFVLSLSPSGRTQSITFFPRSNCWLHPSLGEFYGSALAACFPRLSLRMPWLLHWKPFWGCVSAFSQTTSEHWHTFLFWSHINEELIHLAVTWKGILLHNCLALCPIHGLQIILEPLCPIWYSSDS